MIFLVQINYTQDHSETVLPLGILAVGSILKKRGFQVELININEKEIDQTVDYLVAKKPLYIGLSVMTGIQTEHSAEFSKKIKAKSDIPIVWGGIHPSLLPKQCLESDYIDYVIIGEGEETIIEFTDNLKNKKSFKKISGLGYKERGVINVNPKRPFIKNLDQYRLDFNLIDLEKYIFKLDKYNRVIAYKTSRGCPYNCAFCYNHQFNRNQWRAWSTEIVIEDINFLKEKYKIEAVKFYDDNFFVDKERALKILRTINLPSHTEVRIDAIDESLAQELKRLNSFDLLIGMESGSNRLLELINKRITVDDIVRAVKILAKNGLKASYSTMVGLPGETKEEFNSTIDLMYQTYKIHSQAGFTMGAYLPYPGSKLYQFSIEQGFQPPAKTENWGKIDRFRNKFVSPWVDAQRVWRIRECFKFLSMKLGFFNKWFEWRIKNRFFALPLDIYAFEYLSNIAIEEKSIVGKLLRRMYNFLRNVTAKDQS